MSPLRLARCIALLGMFLIGTPLAQAQSTAAPINPNLKDALDHLPIPGIQGALNGLFGALKKGESGGYAAQTTITVPGLGSVPLQLYFFGKDEKQVLLLVVDTSVGLPPVFNNHAWKQLAGATLTDPIFSVSTVDFMLGVSDMPAPFRKVIADGYYNVGALSFTSGFQVAARIRLGGAMKTAIVNRLGFPVQDFTMRAGVSIPVPSDPASSAQLAAELAADMKNVGKVLKDQPNFFVELQPAPGEVIRSPLGMSGLVLTDSTIYLDNKLTLGFHGNILVPDGKKLITFFETPLTPEGVMDLTDFEFGFTAQTITLQDLAALSMALHTPKVPGGTFVKGIDKFESKLSLLMKPLSVFQIRNPNTVGDYVFGDKNHPFPPKAAFNVMLLGPTASVSDSTGQTIQGPFLRAQGTAWVLQQNLGGIYLTIGESGLHALATAGLSLKLGPLGRQAIGMTASADITQATQSLLMHGGVLGRTLDLSMDPNNLSVSSPATCATPFSLSETVAIQPTLNVSSLMDALPGVNVDPSKLSGCVGDDLKKAYQWVSTTGSSLGGFTAQAANAQLAQIANAEAAAAKAAQDAANKAANAAKDAANDASHTAKKASKDISKGFKSLGKKHHHHHHH